MGHPPSVGVLVGSCVVKNVGFALPVVEMAVERKVVETAVVVLCPTVVVVFTLLSVVATGDACVALISMLMAQLWFLT